MNIEHSAIAKYSCFTKHSIEFDKVDILVNSSQCYERKIIEAIKVRKIKNSFNKDDGFEMSSNTDFNELIKTEKCSSKFQKQQGN